MTLPRVVPPDCPGPSPPLVQAADDYRPRQAQATVLHQVISEHLETFLEDAARRGDGQGLPRFVERELRKCVDCGVLSGGFARVRCDDCHFERLVPFSCGGRRMVERAAHLVDEVLPVVPVRQWVLSLPHQLRYRLAYDHELCRAVLAVYVRALLGFQRRRAKSAGIADGRSGAVTVIQRFGSGLRLNVHFHTKILDGVFHRQSSGQLAFCPLPPPTEEQLARLLTDPQVIRPILDHLGLPSAPPRLHSARPPPSDMESLH